MKAYRGKNTVIEIRIFHCENYCTVVLMRCERIISSQMPVVPLLYTLVFLNSSQVFSYLIILDINYLSSLSVRESGCCIFILKQPAQSDWHYI